MTARTRGTGLAVLLALAATRAVLAQEPPAVPASQETFEIPALEPKPYNLGGYLEFRPSAVWLDQDSLVARLRRLVPGQSWLSSVSGQFLLDAGYRRGPLGGSARVVLDGARAGGDWDGGISLYEASISFKPAAPVSLDLGKRTLKWGKGYAWNPAAFLDRPKNPEDPALALEGFVVASADLIRSFRGPLQTLAFTPVIVPVYDGVNEALGKPGYLHVAGKLYLLLFDSDLDLMFVSGGSRPSRWGLDFSRNLRPDIEVHGELAVEGDEVRKVAGPGGVVVEDRRDGVSWLLGGRYLAPTNTTLIVEYYRRGQGFTRDEMGRYYETLEGALADLEVTGDPRSLQAAAVLTAAGYADRQPMRHYLFGRASQPDAFGQLYLTAALTSIVNLDDGSLSLMQELQYRVLGNLEVRSQVGATLGGRRTDFGERQGSLRLELRARYSF